MASLCLMGKLCSLGGKKENDAVLQSNFGTSNLSSSCFDLFFFIINIYSHALLYFTSLCLDSFVNFVFEIK